VSVIPQRELRNSIEACAGRAWQPSELPDL
jgi:hypothetical protein